MASTVCRRVGGRHVLYLNKSTFTEPRRKLSPVFAYRLISTSSPRNVESRSDSAYSQPAQDLSQEITTEEKNHWSKVVAEDKSRQIKTPWHRDGADQSPASRPRSANAMTRGKLLTTPSRMLKLVLPLTTEDQSPEGTDVEPLALLVHPQQPLSYLERLIQAELPVLKVDGKDKIPGVHFRAEDSMQDNAKSDEKRTKESKNQGEEAHEKDLEKADVTMIDGKSAKTGKLSRKTERVQSALRGGHGEGGVESYSGSGQASSAQAPSKILENETEDDDHPSFVRWSSSTEIGDFIRDAARGKEFSVEIEGAPQSIYVGVPSFKDRTFYLRMRLRKRSREIAHLADIKKECDHIAERHAKRVALAGGMGLVAWWGVVYQFTFRSDLGWDVMEPVTYLVGLSTLIGGYAWFLYHNREVSYRSAMKYTISRRQSALYELKGFDVNRWEDLIEEGNKLRSEIKAVAQEYDVEWLEKEDEESEKVIQALKEDRKKKNQEDGDDKKEKKDEDSGDD